MPQPALALATLAPLIATRIAQLESELAALKPLLTQFRKGKPTVEALPHIGSTPKTRKPLSAAARAKVSKRMKLYWASRRLAAKGKSPVTAKPGAK